MKKICLFLVVVILAMMLGSCYYSEGPGNYYWAKIHIDTHNFSGCYTIEKWYESGTGIEVKTKEVGYMFVSEGAYILVGDKCPICDAEEEQ